MEKILVLGHVEADGSLVKSTLESIAAAKELGGEFCVGLIGGDVAKAANQITGCGAARIYGVSGADFTQARYATDAAAAEVIVKAAQAGIVIVSQTSRWARVVSGVAARLGGRVDTHVTGIAVADGKLSVSRWYYRQRMEAVMSRTQRPWFIAIDPGCRAPWQGAAGTAAVEAVNVSVPAVRTQVTGVVSPSAGKQTIRPDAAVLFVAGAGWTKKQADGQTHVPDAEKLILGFLDATNASLGSSKSLVDLSGEGQAVLTFMSHLNQIGQTGSTPRHPKGLSTCCHGEEPHAVGWRFINERRAINLDANCGWARGKADVLYVADAFAVMTKVNELLAAKK
jgi:electron transfer flavoprotein alpha subunit